MYAIGDVAIMETYKDSDNKDQTRFIAFVNDYESGMLEEGKTYIFLLSGEVDGVAFNVANMHFRDKGDLSMRLWIRAAVTVVPMLFLFAALIIQHKKFIIDEKYYDMMMAEINSRHTPVGQADNTTAETVVATEETKE